MCIRFFGIFSFHLAISQSTSDSSSFQRRRILRLRTLPPPSHYLFPSQSLKAQATPAASKEGEFSVYGAYARVSTDYGAQKDNGAIFGAEYTRFMHFFLTPTLELRGKVATGPNVNQRTWGGGLRG